MMTGKNVTLDDALRAARELPETEQRQIAEVLVTLVENRRRSRLTPVQREIVRQRLQNQRRIASSEDVEAVLRRFDPTS